MVHYTRIRCFAMQYQYRHTNNCKQM